jgi:hypothetical protein
LKTNSDKWLNYIGELCLPKQKVGEADEDYKLRANKKKFISVVKDFAMKEGSTARLQKLSDYLGDKKDKGWLSQEDYDKKMLRGATVKYVLSLAPQDEEVEIETSSEWQNKAFEIRKKVEKDPAKKDSFFLVAKKDFAVTKGEFLSLTKVAEAIEERFEKGQISEEDKERQLNAIRIKDEEGNPVGDFWLIYSGDIAPKRGE